MDWSKYLPSKTLLWKEWKNNWVFMAVFFGYVTFISSITLINKILRYKDILQRGVGSGPHVIPHGMYDLHRLLSFENAVIGFGLIILTIMLAAMMIGQERERNTFNLLLAMPYSRNEVIYNKFVTSLGQLLIIFAFNALVMTLLVWTNAEIPYPFGAADIWAWAWRNIVVLWFVFAFTMFISSISGTTFGNGLLSLIFLFFPLGLFTLIIFNLEFWHTEYYRSLLHGLFMYDDAVLLLTVPAFIMDNDIIGQRNLPLIYGILLALTGCLYKITQYLFSKNQLEYNGEVLMFKQLEGFFKLGVAVCFTLLGGPLVLHLFNLHSGNTNLALASIVYLLVGLFFWLLVTRLIKWRQVA